MAAGLAIAMLAAPACTRGTQSSAGDGIGELARLQAGERVVELCLLVADTPEGRKRGLSGRESLGPYDGMLFVLERSGPHRFWMKDTAIPLDLVPITPEAALLPPIPMTPCPGGTVCPDYGPDSPYDRALELPQGRLRELGFDLNESPTTFERTGAECPIR